LSHQRKSTNLAQGLANAGGYLHKVALPSKTIPFKEKTMRKIALATIFGACTLLSAGANAQVGLSGQIGTSGVGVHLSYPILSSLNVRVGVNNLNFAYSSSTNDVSYDLKFKLNTADLLVDYFPFDGNFHITAGLTNNGNKVDVHAQPKANGTYVLNGTTYSSADVGQIDGIVEFNKSTPYLGVGWGNTSKDAGWGFTSDLGVLFQGKPKTSLNYTGCKANSLICAQLANDIAAEHAAFDDNISGFKAYPVLRLGVNYRF
jgi:hypothetical protein